MHIPPIPVVFDPIYKPKPWGGRRLEALFGKRLPPGELIGESWELVSLPGNESRVRGGPLAGVTLADLVSRWGRDLYGSAELIDGRFPLLIKFLDARENLSVQVHPRPRTGPPASDVGSGVKHEAWYIVHADPGAELFVGVKPGVTAEDLAAVANSPAIADLLRRWPASAGQWFNLPSGIAHALGSGIVVAEVQTPSDVTYRLYDWGRVDSAGNPRELHIEAALANLRLDVPESSVSPPIRSRLGAKAADASAQAEGFGALRLREPPELDRALRLGQSAVWVVLAGQGALDHPETRLELIPGDVVLVPAENSAIRARMVEPFEVLALMPPGASL